MVNGKLTFEVEGLNIYLKVNYTSEVNILLQNIQSNLELSYGLSKVELTECYYNYKCQG